jgi:hypothetical protein
MVKEVVNLLAKNMGSSYNANKGLLKRVWVERHYSIYSKIGYNSHTYTAEIENISNSEGSNK